MTQFLVEVFLPRLGAGDLATTEERAKAAAKRVSGKNVAVRYLRATYVPEDETCFYVFEAPSADLVARASALAGLGDGRIVGASETDLKQAGSIIGLGRRRAVRKTKEGIMGSNIAFGRLVVLVLVVAALGTGTAVASNTPQGLKADGLRLQGIAQMYERLRTPSAASFYTPRALKAEGMRWEAMARAYRGHKAVGAGLGSSSSSGFDWSAAFIGAASGLGFASVGVVLLLRARRVRRTKVAV